MRFSAPVFQTKSPPAFLTSPRHAPHRSGASGTGWYRKFEEEGQDGFRKAKPPTPFDWTEAGATSLVFVDISIDGAKAVRAITTNQGV